MKIIKPTMIATSCGIALSILSYCAHAAAPEPGWYTTLSGGVSNVSGNVDTTPSDGFSRSGADYNTGYNLGWAIGYKSGPLRYDVEASYIYASLDNFSLAGIPINDADGNSSAIAGLVNIYYDFEHFTGHVVPYIGGGIGYAHIDAELNSSTPITSHFDESDNQFAYQGTAGLSWNFSNSASVIVAYRYFGTTDSGELGKMFQANLGIAGLVYRFDEM